MLNTYEIFNIQDLVLRKIDERIQCLDSCITYLARFVSTYRSCWCVRVARRSDLSDLRMCGRDSPWLISMLHHKPILHGNVNVQHGRNWHSANLIRLISWLAAYPRISGRQSEGNRWFDCAVYFFFESIFVHLRVQNPI